MVKSPDLPVNDPAASTAFSKRNLPLLLLQARESVIRRFRPVLTAHGLTEQQWRVLRIVAERGPTEPRELVELCALSSPSLAGILARMDDLGLIARERMETDQRRILVSITPRSRTLVGRLAPQVDAIYEEIDAALGADFSGRLYQMLDRVVAVLGPESEAPDA